MERQSEAGPGIKELLNKPGVTAADILSVELYYLSSKTFGKVKAVVRHPKHLAKRSAIQQTVLDDLVQWMLHSEVKSDYELLSKYSIEGRKKTVNRKDVRKAIKDTVIEMGLAPANFSNKSLHSGFSSHVVANGVGESEMKKGGWTENSHTSSQQPLYPSNEG